MVEQAALRAGSLREVYGELAPLAVTDADGVVTIAPGRDHVVASGDLIALVGPADVVRTAGLLRPRPAPAAYVGARAPRPGNVRATSWVRYAARSTDRRVKLALAALGALVVTSVTVRRRPGTPERSVHCTTSPGS